MASLQARDLMTAEIVIIPPDMAVDAIARLLVSQGITAAPLVDDGGWLLGLVTTADLTCRLIR